MSDIENVRVAARRAVALLTLLVNEREEEASDLLVEIDDVTEMGELVVAVSTCLAGILIDAGTGTADRVLRELGRRAEALGAKS